ncbi:B-box zinc finger protein [Actinomarinicola tropica]|uniref:Uncharacterized protein n=1 Tax=Actinomarinicola tropica TaxID=2789776 RepID=A0A5Q2RU79_9ACTN|nr:hypothetical protein [Actinomarinicola tropica]QGG96765.1 hypothetical protein GH723_17610 [Actinomarinicola tropica]
MDGRCDKHPFEPADRTCRTCGGEFCTDCLVFSHGPRKPPYCVSCALAAAGVRSSASRPTAVSKRDLRKKLRAERKAAKVASKSGQAAPVRVVEYEFTITDDGRIERPAERAS